MSKEGTLIKTRYPYLYFDNVDVASVESAESLSNDLDKHFEKIKGEIQTLIFATPKDITPKGEEPIDYLKERIEDIFDELYEVARDYYTVDIIKDILNEWSYGGYSDDKELYKDAKTNAEVNDNAFIEDKHIEIKRDFNKFTFAPPENDVNETITRCIKNIQLNDSLSENILDKYIILLGNKPYVDYDGQFLFASKEKAENVLKKKMDFHSIDYISRDFIDLHPNYFISVIENLSNDKDKFIEDFKLLVDGNIFHHMNEIEFVNKVFGDYVINEVFKLLGIKIVTFRNLIYSYIIDTSDYKENTKKMMKDTLK